VFAHSNAAEMEQEEDQQSCDGLVGERQECERHYTHRRAYPEALYGKIVHVSAALDRWPEQALQASIAARSRIGEAKCLHGGALNPKPEPLSSEKSVILRAG
jgi:hypothetical protein